MPRRARVTQPGFHHIINRGVARQNVFLNRGDKDYFLKLLDEVFISYDFILHSYILMDNHYHLLIENQRDNLSAGMRKLNSQYAQYFNKKYNRVGHLWQDRYLSKYIQNKLYLLTLHKYIEYNPIKANITNKIGEFYRSLAYDMKHNTFQKSSYKSIILSSQQLL